ncbi:hypothetical protein A3D78_01685 [Candidatus Gottesmanbacteria bacterium RIFCSPHIGHO2_02_FULL_39_14]|uniref:Uncharacterized protein n=1 Tax=Candidatus Gottesmanbacteria bacterium RIFCSPHIGHO2_02_FULL_39_14 TaxID=1798383 RepID=A0A1F5ZYM5_9BACT|nr:MAG: hypothetical protein A3D78_01685 [Candidatus Gottesmanbacteria bacterium RIFCSPHIGHO2_02_FULL_39_14]
MLPAPAKQNEETSDSSEKQEEQPLTYDDKLAENYRDLSGQNAVFIQLTIALALKGSHDHREVLHAYKTLKNPLDPKKLVEDPAYRQEVERCLALVEKCEKKALKKGKCKLKEEIERTRFSLTQVKTTYQNLHIFQTDLSRIYGLNIGQIYNLNNNQVEEVYKRALAVVKENPQLTLQESMRTEARNEAVRQVREEVEADKKIGIFRKKNEIEKRVKAASLDEKGKTFTEETQQVRTLEDLHRRKTLDEGISSVSLTQTQSGQVRSFETKKAPERAGKLQNFINQAKESFKKTVSPIFKPFSIAAAKITKFLNIQKLLLEQIRETIRKAIKAFIENTIKAMVRRMVKWVMKTITKEAIKFAAKALLTTVSQALNAVAPVLGGIAGAIISSLIVDIGFKLGKYLIMGGVGLAFFLFFLNDSSGTNKFPIGVKNAELMSVRKIENNSYAWKNFERNVLGMEIKKDENWQEFAEKYLNINRELLSLEGILDKPE